MAPNPRVVLIEPDRTLRRLLQAALQARGFEVRTAGVRQNPSDAAGSALVVVPSESAAGYLAAVRSGGPAVLVTTAPDSAAEQVRNRLDEGAGDVLRRPFSLREFGARAVSLLHRSAAGHRDLRGEIEDISPSALLRLLAVQRRTGLLRVDLDLLRVPAEIDFREGAIVRAQVGLLRGAEAAWQLLLHERGRFVFEVDEPPRVEIDEIPVLPLLMEGFRLLEAGILRRVEPENPEATDELRRALAENGEPLVDLPLGALSDRTRPDFVPMSATADAEDPDTEERDAFADDLEEMQRTQVFEPVDESSLDGLGRLRRSDRTFSDADNQDTLRPVPVGPRREDRRDSTVSDPFGRAELAGPFLADPDAVEEIDTFDLSGPLPGEAEEPDLGGGVFRFDEPLRLPGAPPEPEPEEVPDDSIEDVEVRPAPVPPPLPPRGAMPVGPRLELDADFVAGLVDLAPPDLATLALGDDEAEELDVALAGVGQAADEAADDAADDTPVEADAEEPEGAAADFNALDSMEFAAMVLPFDDEPDDGELDEDDPAGLSGPLEDFRPRQDPGDWDLNTEHVFQAALGDSGTAAGIDAILGTLTRAKPVAVIEEEELDATDQEGEGGPPPEDLRALPEVAAEGPAPDDQLEELDIFDGFDIDAPSAGSPSADGFDEDDGLEVMLGGDDEFPDEDEALEGSGQYKAVALVDGLFLDEDGPDEGRELMLVYEGLKKVARGRLRAESVVLADRHGQVVASSIPETERGNSIGAFSAQALGLARRDRTGRRFAQASAGDTHMVVVEVDPERHIVLLFPEPPDPEQVLTELRPELEGTGPAAGLARS